MFASLLFNALLALTDGAVASGWRGPAGRRLAVSILHPVVGVVGAIALGENLFGALRLLAWYVFCHVPIVLIAATCLLARRSPRAAACPALLALVGLAIAGDAFLVEPTWLEVSRIAIPSPEIDRPLTIALLADIQTDRVGDHERRALEAAADARPDLILLAGDYIQLGPDGYATEAARLADLLTGVGLEAPLGIHAVRGNVDPEAWPTCFEGTAVVAHEETDTIDLGPLRLTCLSFSDSFRPDLRLASEPGLHVALGHGPDFALGGVEADLLLAGHTHGGQVRLPIVGPPLTLSRIPRAWAAGATDLGRGRTLVVSRGIGHERGHAPRLRFLCRPQVVLIDVVPE